MDVFQLWLFISLIKVLRVSPRVLALLLVLSKAIVVLPISDWRVDCTQKHIISLYVTISWVSNYSSFWSSLLSLPSRFPSSSSFQLSSVSEVWAAALAARVALFFVAITRLRGWGGNTPASPSKIATGLDGLAPTDNQYLILSMFKLTSFSFLVFGMGSNVPTCSKYPLFRGLYLFVAII